MPGTESPSADPIKVGHAVALVAKKYHVGDFPHDHMVESSFELILGIARHYLPQ